MAERIERAARRILESLGREASKRRDGSRKVIRRIVIPFLSAALPDCEESRFLDSEWREAGRDFKSSELQESRALLALRLAFDGARSEESALKAERGEPLFPLRLDDEEFGEPLKGERWIAGARVNKRFSAILKTADGAIIDKCALRWEPAWSCCFGRDGQPKLLKEVLWKTSDVAMCAVYDKENEKWEVITSWQRVNAAAAGRLRPESFETVPCVSVGRGDAGLRGFGRLLLCKKSDVPERFFETHDWTLPEQLPGGEDEMQRELLAFAERLGLKILNETPRKAEPDALSMSVSEKAGEAEIATRKPDALERIAAELMRLRVPDTDIEPNLDDAPRKCALKIRLEGNEMRLEEFRKSFGLTDNLNFSESD